ncbi:hypothetical protein [Methanoregula sp.]|uniref:hypothetical protein n=1 Tax=Methanoregula sp. TaxID=2052170 RepID=UPI0026255964|nr:hypothetical protein [Methanoregula sp.]MDD5144439.1 hypothetical protein [Methanoregula sp.]
MKAAPLHHEKSGSPGESARPVRALKKTLRCRACHREYFPGTNPDTFSICPSCYFFVYGDDDD